MHEAVRLAHGALDLIGEADERTREATGMWKKHFKDMHVRIYGIVGIVNGVVVRTGGAKTQRTLFTDVFAYRDGKWQAINAQELHPEEAPH